LTIFFIFGRSSKIGLIEHGASYENMDKLLVLDTEEE
jgi:hypothetical protein